MDESEELVEGDEEMLTVSNCSQSLFSVNRVFSSSPALHHFREHRSLSMSASSQVLCDH